MNQSELIGRAQEIMKQHDLDGWLVYDFQKSNPIFWRYLGLPNDLLLSKRCFYWIPVHGEPTLLMHRVDDQHFEILPGNKELYLGVQQLQEVLKVLLAESGTIAMEYSPYGHLPALSRVDAGTIEFVKECDVTVVSSSRILGELHLPLTDEQYKSHLKAADFLDQLAEKTWKFIGESSDIFELDVILFMEKQMAASGYETNHRPICAVGKHSANPHYTPVGSGAPINKGDFILIDLFCKEKGGIYGDITRVAVLGRDPSKKELEVFHLVREGQKLACDFVKNRIESNEIVKGFEVDEVVRDLIQEAGYGEYFVHRLGHNIDEELHGSGPHLDSLETLDDRRLLANTCYSVEPGIYISGSFGIRLEHDLFLHEDRIEVTGGVQESLKVIR